MSSQKKWGSRIGMSLIQYYAMKTQQRRKGDIIEELRGFSIKAIQTHSETDSLKNHLKCDFSICDIY